MIVAYTKKAARNYADIERELVDLAIEEANRSFRLSNLGHISLRLVHAYQHRLRRGGRRISIMSGASPTRATATWRRSTACATSIAPMSRSSIVDDPKGCGLATRVAADADEAFAVVHHACAAASYTVAHEIGHLIGARHELSYVNGTKWRDIMGYQGKLRRLPARARVVEPDGAGQRRACRHGRARQCPRDRGTGRARRRLPMIKPPRRGPSARTGER